MLQLIKILLQKFINDIDSNNCNLDENKQRTILMLLSNMQDADLRMSKLKAAEYIGVSRATFDNYVHDGLLPKGIKEAGFPNLVWYKFEIDLYLNKLL